MSVILFPHSWLPSSSIKKICDIFGSLTIFRPWYLDDFLSKDELENLDKVKVINPKDDRRPGKKFKGLISEFRDWIAYNNDRSYREILKTGQQGAVSDETLWDIRRMIKRIDDINPDQDENQIFRWNLTLHLAADIEKQRFDAENLLKDLKNRNPLLKDSVETVEDVENLFEDFPGFEPEAGIHESGIGPLLEAWFGLFESYLDEREIFITMNKKILDYIIEQDEGISTDVKNSMIDLKIPDIWLRDESKIRKIRDSITGLGKKPEDMLPDFKRFSKSFNEAPPVDIQGKNCLISMAYLKSTGDFKKMNKDNFLNKLSGKVIILFQED